MARDERLTLRVDAKIKDELAKIADKDHRTLSSLVEKIISEWLAKRRPKR